MALGDTSSAPPMRWHIYAVIVVIVVVLAMLGYGGWQFMQKKGHAPTTTSEGVTPDPSFSWGTSLFAITSPLSPGVVLFSNGEFTSLEKAPEATTVSLLLPPYDKTAGYYTSDPAQHQVRLSSGKVVKGATDSIMRAESSDVVVRTEKGFSICDTKASCTEIYSFAEAMHGPVIFAVDRDRFALVHPVTHDLQVFSILGNGNTSRLNAVRTMQNPFPKTTAIAFDSGRKDRLVFFNSSLALPIQMSTSGGSMGKLTVCALDGLFEKGDPVIYEGNCATRAWPVPGPIFVRSL